MTQEPTTAAPVCYRHPDRHTMLSCSHCGRPICGACSIDASVGQRCPECVKGEGTQKVIPTGPRRSRSYDAPVTKTIVAVTVVVYLASNFGAFQAEMYFYLSQINELVAQGEWWRIFSAALLHSPLQGGFSITHILFNMWVLWVLGPQVERSVGPLPFLGLYVASAGVGGLFYFLLVPGGSAIGASGAVFGLFGFWLSTALAQRHTMRGRAILNQIGFLLILNLLLPFMLPGIAWQAHLGGLIAGFGIAEVWRRVRGPRANRIRSLAAWGVAILAAMFVLI